MLALRRKQAYYISEEKPLVWTQGRDILKEAHILIGGSTRCGKSTLIHKLMWTALARTPGSVKFIIIDMKEGVEMYRYKDLPHVLRFADTEADALSALDYAVAVTRSRLREMKENGLVKYEGADLYVVIDELGFLLQACGNAALDKLTLLGRIAAAAKIHLLMATQDPSKRGCPASLQVNCTCLIGMKCRDAMQSRQIIGMGGCEALPRYGLAYVVIGCDTYALPITPQPEADYQKRIHHWLDSNKCIVYK